MLQLSLNVEVDIVTSTIVKFQNIKTFNIPLTYKQRIYKSNRNKTSCKTYSLLPSSSMEMHAWIL